MANELKDIEYHSSKGERLENLIRYVNKETLKGNIRNSKMEKQVESIKSLRLSMKRT